MRPPATVTIESEAKFEGVLIRERGMVEVDGNNVGWIGLAASAVHRRRPAAGRNEFKRCILRRLHGVALTHSLGRCYTLSLKHKFTNYHIPTDSLSLSFILYHTHSLFIYLYHLILILNFFLLSFKFTQMHIPFIYLY